MECVNDADGAPRTTATGNSCNNNNVLRPGRLSFRRLFFGHFHWKCLICSLFCAVCALHVSYCQLHWASGAAVSSTASNRHHGHPPPPPHQQHSIVSTAAFPSSSAASHQSSATAGPCSHGYNLIPMALGALLYMIYLSECWHYRCQLCSLPRLGAGQVRQLATALCRAVPVVWWKSMSYHYLRRTRQVIRQRNGHPVTRLQVFYERVNSHQSGNVFLYDQCGYKDITMELSARQLERHPMVWMRFSKGFVFASLQAANEFEEQRTRFFMENEMLDDYMEVREGMDLADLPFLERVLVFPERKTTTVRNRRRRRHPSKLPYWPNNNNNNNDDADADVEEANADDDSSTSSSSAAAASQFPTAAFTSPSPYPTSIAAAQLPPSSNLQIPWWFLPWVFWPASLLLLSWPIRIWAECRAAQVHLQVTKLFGTNYLSPSNGNYTGPLTRTSTMDSRELELANRENYLIVPSYSQAILLDPYQQQQQQSAVESASMFFRQLFFSTSGSSSTANQQNNAFGMAPPPPVSHQPMPTTTATANGYGSFARTLGAKAQQPKNKPWTSSSRTTGPPNRSRSFAGCIVEDDLGAANNNDEDSVHFVGGQQFGNIRNGSISLNRTGSCHQQQQQRGRHLPRPSLFPLAAGQRQQQQQYHRRPRRAAQQQQQPTRSITISEGFDRVPSSFHQQQQQHGWQQQQRNLPNRNCCSDRMPLLYEQQQQQQQLEEATNHLAQYFFSGTATEQQQLIPPGEPPPPYELALRYCSPIYQRLRQSVQSISSLFSSTSNAANNNNIANASNNNNNSRFSAFSASNSFRRREQRQQQQQNNYAMDANIGVDDNEEEEEESMQTF